VYSLGPLGVLGREQALARPSGQKQVVDQFQAPVTGSTVQEGRHGRSGTGQRAGRPGAVEAGVPRAFRGLEPRSDTRDVAQESQRLMHDWRQWQQSPARAPMRATRQRLPASRAARLSWMPSKGAPVSVLCGATGCGKSTQVPQFILEDAVEQGAGAACTIVCTQPRRVAAVGLAQRVAQERGRAWGRR